MKKILRIEGLDCANCANKLENKLKKIKEIQEVNVSFITQKIVLEINDNDYSESLIDSIKQQCLKVEPDIIFK